MRDLKEVARQSKAKAQKKLKRGAPPPPDPEEDDDDDDLEGEEEEDDDREGAEAEGAGEEDEDDDAEVVVLTPVRADGKRGTPRESLSSRKAKGKKKPTEEEEEEDDGGEFDPGAPEAVRKRLAKMRVAEVGKGAGEMSAYAGGHDGEVLPLKGGKQQTVAQAEAELTSVQDKKLKRARVFLKGAVIVDVIIDLEYGTTTALHIKPAKSKEVYKIPVKVTESGQVFFKVPK